MFTFTGRLQLFQEHPLEVIIIVFFYIFSPAHELLVNLIWLDLDHLRLRLFATLRLPFVLGFLLSSLKLRRRHLLHCHDHRVIWCLDDVRTRMKLIEDLVVVCVVVGVFILLLLQVMIGREEGHLVFAIHHT